MSIGFNSVSWEEMLSYPPEVQIPLETCALFVSQFLIQAGKGTTNQILLQAKGWDKILKKTSLKNP